MTVKRYTPTQCCEHDGTYVTYSDYQKLVAENLELKAENCIQDFIITAVKDLVRESEGVIGWHRNGDVASWDEVLPELSHSETPATDAAIAEIKAQGVDVVIEKLMRMVEVAHKSDKETIFAVRSSVVKLAANLRAGRNG